LATSGQIPKSSDAISIFTKYLTRRPVLEASKTLRTLYTSLTDVDYLDAATAWLQQFHAWYQTHPEFLKRHSYLTTTTAANRHKTLPADQTY